jgi:hypothetical protein
VGALTETGLVRIEQGRSAFNRGEYFASHELWEEVWKDLDGADRTFVQGLIQIAAGLHHLQQRRPRPAAAQLRKGLDKVAPGAVALPAHWRIEALTRDLAQILAELDLPGAKLTERKLPTL